MTAGPRRSTGAALLAGAAVLVLVCVAADPAGRVLAVPAAVALAAAGLRDLLLRPVLRADAGGVVVLAGLTRHRAPWDDVEVLRVVTDRRSPALELDLGDRLVVLSRLRLGRAPQDVLQELLAVRP